MPIVRVYNPGGNSVRINTPGVKNVRTSVAPSVTGTSAPTTLEALTDVDASDSDSNEVLVFNEDTGKYEIKVIPVIDGGIF